MQYQGGKSRIARSIADIISLTGGGEPNEIPGREIPYIRSNCPANLRTGGGLLCQPILRVLTDKDPGVKWAQRAVKEAHDA